MATIIYARHFMQRRDFLRNTAILGAVMATPSTVLGAGKAMGNKRVFDLTLNHEILEAGKKTRLWIPLPFIREYQSVSDIKFDGNFSNPSVDYKGVPTLYVDYAEVAKPTLSVKFRVETFERNTDFSKVNFNENEKLSPDLMEFVNPWKHLEISGSAELIKPWEHVRIDGIVKQKAEEITKGVKGDLERAKAIYTWVANTMQRDNSVIGCGSGDVKAILQSGKLVGKCTDINSVFVGLCRAVGIPAREIFGIRVGQSRFSNEMGKADEKGLAAISGGQHCRAEFYLKGHGWIPVDPADVTKVRLGEKLSNDDGKLVKIREYLFGNWEMCWIGFNDARNFVLSPKPAEFPLNNFGYPYGEVDDNVLNYYSPKDFSYDYKSQELK